MIVLNDFVDFGYPQPDKQVLKIRWAGNDQNHCLINPQPSTEHRFTLEDRRLIAGSGRLILPKK